MTALLARISELRSRWPIFLPWAVAHIFSFLLILPSYWIANASLGPNNIAMTFLFVMAMFSFVLGAVQGVVLHAYQNQLSRWLWSTVTSAALLLTSNLAYWLFQRLTQQGYRPVLGYYDYLPIGGAIVGCGLGLAQWLVLRGMTTGAHSWLWVTAWALATALTSVLLFGPILNNLSSWYGIGGWVAKLSLSALFTGGITGIFLLRLVRELDTVQE